MPESNFPTAPSSTQEFIAANKIEEAIESMVKQTENFIKYEYSPQIKTKETQLFEELVIKMLNGEKVDFTKDDKGTLFLTYNLVENGISTNKKVNFAELMNKVNLTHVNIPEEHHGKYIDFLHSRNHSFSSEASYRKTIKDYDQKKLDKLPEKITLLKEKFKSELTEKLSKGELTQVEYNKQLNEGNKFIEESEKRKIKEESLNNLTYAEMAAIRVYTGTSYTDMNNFLRQQYKKLEDDELSPAMIHCALCSQALNKVADSDIKHAIRKEALIPNSKFAEETIKERIENVKKGGVSIEKGFISTSTDTLSPHAHVTILYSNIKGKYIAPLSKYPSEREFLMAPGTQIRWEAHEKINPYKHIFSVSGANVLLSQSKQDDSEAIVSQGNKLKENQESVEIKPLPSSESKKNPAPSIQPKAAPALPNELPAELPPELPKVKIESDKNLEKTLKNLKAMTQDVKYFKLGKIKLFTLPVAQSKDLKELVKTIDSILKQKTSPDKKLENLNNNFEKLSNKLSEIRTKKTTFVDMFTGKKKLKKKINKEYKSNPDLKKFVEKYKKGKSKNIVGKS